MCIFATEYCKIQVVFFKIKDGHSAVPNSPFPPPNFRHYKGSRFFQWSPISHNNLATGRQIDKKIGQKLGQKLGDPRKGFCPTFGERFGDLDLSAPIVAMFQRISSISNHFRREKKPYAPQRGGQRDTTMSAQKNPQWLLIGSLPGLSASGPGTRQSPARTWSRG